MVRKREFERRIRGMLERIIDGQPGKGPVLAGAEQHPKIKDMLKYFLLNTGNLWRPLLLESVAGAYNAPYEQVVHYSSLVEAVHSTSLVIDDTYCMDNAGDRRGKPSFHHAFSYPKGASKDAGTANTFLASFNALDYVEAAIRHGPASDSQNKKIADEVTRAKINLDAGQYIDLFEVEKMTTLRDFAGFYALKTGSLFGAAMAIGGILGKEKYEGVERLRESGIHLGVSYQFADDLLDFGGDKELVGKTLGLDARKKNLFDVASAEEIFSIREEYEKTARDLLDKVSEKNGMKFTKTKRLMTSMSRAFNRKMKKPEQSSGAPQNFNKELSFIGK